MTEISNTPVSFGEWNTVLAGDQTLDAGARERYRQFIVVTCQLNPWSRV